MCRYRCPLPDGASFGGPLFGGPALDGLAWGGLSTAAAGGVLYGAALLLLALWCGVFDTARRTWHAGGLPRYMAVCLLSGYAWLALAGAAWAGVALGCPGRDLALHALGLGFITSLVMAHAAVVLPAVARIRLRFGPWFYAPWLLLQLSLLLRLVAGSQAPSLRLAGAIGNALALALFGATVALSARAWQRRRRPDGGRAANELGT